MHISPGHIRNAITNSSYKIPKLKGGMSADGVLRKAIKVYHADGVEDATHYVESALTKEFWRTGRGAPLAKHVRQDLDAYVHLAAPDHRVAATVSAKHPVRMGDHTVAADVDVLLHGGGNYVGRMAIAARQERPYTVEELALIAAAPLHGLVDELEGGLFGGIVEAIEVWELRLARASLVARQDAEAAWPKLVERLLRAVAE
ncbi:hypothetical protein KZZ52_01845 [Dactylosporangium sp. AC04546]|uniref:hypothetical protein n=1 Tax=Dactylosporangium sp. AC04546 TaxID=2862460 RepID=UPI001EDCA092|nr:hypothetical protein [Dactylosporangium sp. AC04546]WVK84201.1 hypothetical protein KZZ52_01845 [Dactylosporangium sp. AC04546]